MSWHEYIHTDPDVLAGKPVIRNTRLAVDFLLSLFAAGWTQEQVLQSYPGSLRRRFAPLSPSRPRRCKMSRSMRFR